ncbi:PepSY domain-containing protein [Streptomyces himalayensis]|uniref:PepSY domain-containing protein n=1 Tax=Streptomyces himalayensis subsp. himalayensis TaxID=2756131 RepID=A0A7W0DGE1_9ACTN|nr:PepSY domain-containing protein [Streptomyces himalayensis]MBA2944609.1 PepSY domain-containing protein [Streptomyces himalayensis subsp. himalayensis]
MKRTIVIAGAAAALIAGGTVTAFAITGDDEAPAARSSVQINDDERDDASEDAADDGTEAKAARVSAVEAIAAALAHTPGTAVSADLEDEDRALVWDVDVLTKGNEWRSVQVDPGTAKVLGSHVEHEDDDDAARVRAALNGASVSAAEAAEALAGRGVVTSVDVDDDGTARGWEVETVASGGERDWNVDLRSGAVTADRPQADDDSDDD